MSTAVPTEQQGCIAVMHNIPVTSNILIDRLLLTTSMTLESVDSLIHWPTDSHPITPTLICLAEHISVSWR